MKFFVPWFETLLSSHQSHLEDLRNGHKEATARALDIALCAKTAETAAVLGALREQVDSLKLQVSELREQIVHERARAEAAVDRLLERDGGVRPVANADIARELAEKSTGAAVRENSRMSAVENIFRTVNGAGEDEGHGDPSEVVDTIGGFKVNGAN